MHEPALRSLRESLTPRRDGRLPSLLPGRHCNVLEREQKRWASSETENWPKETKKQRYGASCIAPPKGAKVQATWLIGRGQFRERCRATTTFGVKIR